MSEWTVLLVLSLVSGTDSACFEHQYKCNDGTCIPLGWLCDGAPDCGEGDDELGCEDQGCSSTEWQCDDGACIDQGWLCDRLTDCNDKSDERKCNYTCNAGDFKCHSDSSCVLDTFQCDGELDCLDGSDEFGCGIVEQGCEGFTCDNKRCINSQYQCDRQNDCGDNSDERGCPAAVCSQAEFNCTAGSCISMNYVCDGITDCNNGADEADCGDRLCDPLTEIKCLSDCLTASKRCDGVKDCDDGSDEAECSSPVKNCTSYQCSNGDCIANAWVCDNQPDCSDGADEMGCTPVTCLSDQFTCSDGKGCTALRARCDGTPDCDDESDEEHCGVCLMGQHTCDNGHCIGQHELCDGFDDCQDASDEINCYHYNCTDAEFECNNGKCISVEYVCDGDPDCFALEDESNEICQRNCTGYKCGSGECIEAGWRCDGVVDCSDGSDEGLDCASPCEGFRCKMSGECISALQECDHSIDCRDGSDEVDCGVNECLSGLAECSQLCINQVIGYTCHCKDGYRLMRDNVTCEDINECAAVPEPCLQQCVNNKGGYRCQCVTGEVEGRSCRGPVTEPVMFISTNLGIQRLHNTLYDTVVPSEDELVLHLEYDAERDVLIYYESKSETVIITFLSDGRSRVLYSQISMTSLTIDTTNSHIYWCDFNAIHRGEYSGGAVETIVNPEEGETPYALTVNDKTNQLYWSVIGVNGSVIKVLDLATNTHTVLYADPSQPMLVTSLAIDQVTGRVYWVDISLQAVHYLTLDNTLVTVHLTSPYSIRSVGDYLYYHNTETGHVLRYNRLTGITETVIGTRVHSFTVIDLTITSIGSSPASCEEGLYSCTTNKCIPEQWVCDGSNDCGDNSDELHAVCETVPCNTESGQHFRCGNGKCISSIWRCDSVKDCTDGSDEEACSSVPECHVADMCQHLYTYNKTCITEEMRCNGLIECADGRDEVGCTVCLDSQYRCDDQCLPEGWLCDGTQDCNNGADEEGCMLCKDGEWFSNGECSVPDPCAQCQQGCVEGQCTCGADYVQDGPRCTLPGPPPHILTLTNDGKLRGRFDLDDVIGFDYHYAERLVVWASGNAVHSMNWELKTKPVVLFNYSGTLGSLRVNWVSDKIYWTNSTTSSIWVSNMDGSSAAMLLKLEHRPHHLRVDTISGQLYFIAREDGLRKSVVYRLNGDGTGLEMILEDFHPVLITLDHTTDTLYWYDVQYKAVFSTKDQGQTYRTIKKGLSLQSLTYFNGVLYWSTLAFEVQSYDMISGMLDTIREREDGVSLYPYHPVYQQQSQYSYPCRSNNGGCEDLCFSYPQTHACGCVTDQQVKHCTPAYEMCPDSYCGDNNVCELSNEVESREPSCRCMSGRTGGQCEWSECSSVCEANTTCYYNHLDQEKVCCSGDPTNCHPSTQHQKKSSSFNYQIVIAVMGSFTAYLVLVAVALWYRRWRNKRMGSSTLVDIYPMEPVPQDYGLMTEDDEPLLYD